MGARVIPGLLGCGIAQGNISDRRKRADFHRFLRHLFGFWVLLSFFCRHCGNLLSWQEQLFDDVLIHVSLSELVLQASSHCWDVPEEPILICMVRWREAWVGCVWVWVCVYVCVCTCIYIHTPTHSEHYHHKVNVSFTYKFQVTNIWLLKWPPSCSWTFSMIFLSLSWVFFPYFPLRSVSSVFTHRSCLFSVFWMWEEEGL